MISEIIWLENQVKMVNFRLKSGQYWLISIKECCYLNPELNARVENIIWSEIELD